VSLQAGRVSANAVVGTGRRHSLMMWTGPSSISSVGTPIRVSWPCAAGYVCHRRPTTGYADWPNFPCRLLRTQLGTSGRSRHLPWRDWSAPWHPTLIVQRGMAMPAAPSQTRAGGT